MYKALVRSHIDNCDIIYHIPPKINPAPQLSTFDPIIIIKLFFFLIFSTYSNSHNFRNNNRVELILVPNDAESDQKSSV